MYDTYYPQNPYRHHQNNNSFAHNTSYEMSSVQSSFQLQQQQYADMSRAGSYSSALEIFSLFGTLWEVYVTADGYTYYLDSISKHSQWDDPRIYGLTNYNEEDGDVIKSVYNSTNGKGNGDIDSLATVPSVNRTANDRNSKAKTKARNPTRIVSDIASDHSEDDIPEISTTMANHAKSFHKPKTNNNNNNTDSIQHIRSIDRDVRVRGVKDDVISGGISDESSDEGNAGAPSSRYRRGKLYSDIADTDELENVTFSSNKFTVNKKGGKVALRSIPTKQYDEDIDSLSVENENIEFKKRGLRKDKNTVAAHDSKTRRKIHRDYSDEDVNTDDLDANNFLNEESTDRRNVDSDNQLSGDDQSGNDRIHRPRRNYYVNTNVDAEIDIDDVESTVEWKETSNGSKSGDMKVRSGSDQKIERKGKFADTYDEPEFDVDGPDDGAYDIDGGYCDQENNNLEQKYFRKLPTVAASESKMSSAEKSVHPKEGDSNSSNNDNDRKRRTARNELSEQKVSASGQATLLVVSQKLGANADEESGWDEESDGASDDNDIEEVNASEIINPNTVDENVAKQVEKISVKNVKLKPIVNESALKRNKIFVGTGDGSYGNGGNVLIPAVEKLLTEKESALDQNQMTQSNPPANIPLKSNAAPVASYDSRFQNYIDMLSSGIPMRDVRRTMEASGESKEMIKEIMRAADNMNLSPALITAREGSADKTSKGPTTTTASKYSIDDLKNDPIVGKYAKLSSMGVATGSIAQKMKIDGIPEEFSRKLLMALSFCSEESDNLPRNSESTKTRKASVSLVKLHWDTIPADKLENSIWATTTGEDSLDDLEELEKLFGNQPSSNNLQNTSTSPRAVDEKMKLHYLDPKRSQNIVIGLSQFKSLASSHDEILNAICSLNDLNGKLNADRLENIRNIIPTAVEFKQISRLAQSTHPSEVFFQLCQQYFPELSKRLASFIIISTFNESTNTLVIKMNKLIDCCNEVNVFNTISDNYM